MRTDVRYRRTALRGALGALVSLVLAACGQGGGEAEVEPEERHLDAQVDAAEIRGFADPANELDGVDDLVDYLLPGMTGPGVECVRSELVFDEVVGPAPAEGAAEASEVVARCLDGVSVGKLLAAYAYGFEPDAAEKLPEGYPCVASAFADLDPATAREAVRAVFTVRLDLGGPVGSPAVAREQIEERTDCAATGSGGSGAGSSGAGAAGDLAAGDCVILKGSGPVGSASEVTETTCLGTLATHEVVATAPSASQCPTQTTATLTTTASGTVVCFGPVSPGPSTSNARFPVGSCVSVSGTGLAARPTPLPCTDPAATDEVVTGLTSVTGRCPPPSTRSVQLPSPDLGTLCLKPKSG